MAAPNVPSGIGPPNNLLVCIQTGNSNLDLTTVTGVSLSVSRQVDGSTATWVCSILPEGLSTKIIASYPFQPADTAVLELYDIGVILTVPGGTVPCYSFQINVTVPTQTPFEDT